MLKLFFSKVQGVRTISKLHPTPEGAGPPQAVQNQTLAKAKSFARVTGPSPAATVKPFPKRDPNKFALSNVGPQLFPVSGVASDVCVAEQLLHVSIEYIGRVCAAGLPIL